MIVIEDEQRGTWESLGFLVSGLLGSLQVLVSRRDRELPEQSGTPTSTCFFFLFLAPPPASLASTSRTWAWLGLTTTEKGQGHWGEEQEVEEVFIATQVTHLLSCCFFGFSVVQIRACLKAGGCQNEGSYITSIFLHMMVSSSFSLSTLNFFTFDFIPVLAHMGQYLNRVQD